MYKLWDIAKGEAIRRRDVIFWEDKLGCDALRQHALPRGTEILPISRQYTESHSIPTVDSIPPQQPFLPLKQPPAQQSVTSLPTQQPDPVGTVFENWDVTKMQQKYNHLPPARNLPKPQVSSSPNALFLQNEFSADEWQTWGNIFDDRCHENIPLLLTSVADLDNVDMYDLDTSVSNKYKHPASPFVPSGPRNYREATRSVDWPAWQSAMHDELHKLSQMGAWELVPLPPGQTAIGN